MLKKILSVFIAVTIFSTTVVILDIPDGYTANAAGTYTYAQSYITEIVDSNGITHSAELEAWDGKTATQPAVGDGSEENPYQISTGAELAWFGNYVNKASSTDTSYREACAILTNDINLNNQNWYDFRIGKSYNYVGQFDGQGHTIYNLYINSDNAYSQGGLFRFIGLSSINATVKNINFANANIVSNYTGTSKDSYIGILSGSVSYANTVIENIRVSGKITVGGNNTCTAIIVGGIVGRFSGTMKNCYSDVTIDFSNAKQSNSTYSHYSDKYYGVGGIVGLWNAGSDITPADGSCIENCGFEGTINAPLNPRVGGIAGHIRLSTSNTIKIQNCYNTGNITGYRQVGGIAGWVYNGSYGTNDILYGVYNTGNITATASDRPYAAGLVNGIKGPKLTIPAYSTGDVSVDTNGISGYNEKSGLLYTNLSTENVSWDNTVAAYSSGKTYDNNGTITEKHILFNGNGTSNAAANIKAYTDSEFKEGKANEHLTYSSDTFSLNWSNNENLNNGYPVFTWQEASPLTNGNTYYVSDSSLDVKIDRDGYLYMDITPISENVTVKTDNDERIIDKKGSYAFKIDNTTTSVNVTGKALLYINLFAQKNAGELTKPEPIPIRVSVPDTESRTVFLALYDENDMLKDVVYKENLQPEMIDGVSTLSAIINLTGKTVEDCTIKAFVWENNTLAPVDYISIEPLGKGRLATEEEINSAIRTVAESYMARGSAIQYDSSDINDYGLSRSMFGIKSPEDCTDGLAGYTDEIAFLYDVYKEAFDITIPVTYSDLINNQDINLGQFETTTLSGTLKVGDIVVLKSDKLMLYIGDNRLIYAEGQNYDYENGTEQTEADGALKETNLSNSDILLYETATVLRPLMAEDKIFINQKTQSRIKNMQGIIAEKTISDNNTLMVSPGEEITFTYSVKNTNSKDVTLAVKDIVPENTTYLRGCDDTDGRVLKWVLDIPAGETQSVSYTVKVNSDINLCGTYISGENGTVGGMKVKCPDILIGNLLNETDQSRVITAIHALSDSEFEGATLAKWIYQVAFSKSFTLSGTPAEILEQVFEQGDSDSSASDVTGEEIAETAANLIEITAPGMFGGRKVTENAEKHFENQRARNIDISNLIIGDILIAQQDSSDTESAKMYIYNGEYMMELKLKGMVKNNPESILDKLPSYDRYIVLRPSKALLTLKHYPEEKDILTDEQKAVVDTAYSYLLRGARIQYDDSRFFDRGEFRWQKGLKHPEEYTAMETGYTNCAAFCYDVYYHALDYDIKYFTVSYLSWYGSPVYSFAQTGEETEEEKKEIEEEIMSQLQPGDIVCIMRKNGTGHAMLYVGNETIIHSTGSSYNYSTSTETYEPTIRFRSARDLFTYGTTCNIFDTVETFDIVRPLNKFTETIPENTLNRVANMKGIRAEKLSSHASSTSVNPGDEITFAFAVYNSNENSVTLNINDTVPANTTYVSGDLTANGNELSLSLTVPAGEKKTVSYKVRVKEDTAEGRYIISDSGTVGGVKVECPDIIVKNTLTLSDKEKLTASINAHKDTTLTGPALANSIYNTAFETGDLFTESTVLDVMNSVFASTTEKEGYYVLNEESAYYPMVVPKLYGGRYFYSTTYQYDRVRLPKPHNLIAGDILIARTSSAQYMYLYDGTNLLNLTDGSLAENDTAYRLERLISYQYYFAILRPSFNVRSPLTDATLKSLSAKNSAGDELISDFSPATTSYYFAVSNAEEHGIANITAETTNAEASYKIEEDSANNQFKVIVTAKDGITTKTYYIKYRVPVSGNAVYHGYAAAGTDYLQSATAWSVMFNSGPVFRLFGADREGYIAFKVDEDKDVKLVSATLGRTGLRNNYGVEGYADTIKVYQNTRDFSSISDKFVTTGYGTNLGSVISDDEDNLIASYDVEHGRTNMDYGKNIIGEQGNETYYIFEVPELELDTSKMKVYEDNTIVIYVENIQQLQFSNGNATYCYYVPPQTLKVEYIVCD